MEDFANPEDDEDAEDVDGEGKEDEGVHTDVFRPGD